MRDWRCWFVAAATFALLWPSTVDASSARVRVFDLVGSGLPGSAGDGGRAGQAQLRNPSGVALRPNGAIVVADTANGRVREVSPSGVTSTIAGGGSSLANGVTGTEAKLTSPTAVAVRPDGAVYIAEFGRVRLIDTNGVIITVAGDGRLGSSGNGGLAVNARVSVVGGIIVLSDGTVLISDTSNDQIRRIDLSGRITGVAGSGVTGFAGDGEMARNGEIAGPNALVETTPGHVVFADSGNGVIREFDIGGSIRTVAGKENGVAPANGASALGIEIAAPYGLTSTAGGGIAFTDRDSHRVVVVGRDGNVKSVYGTGACASSSGGEAADQAGLCEPMGIATSSTGGLVLVDGSNAKIKYLHTDRSPFSFTDQSLHVDVLSARVSGRSVALSVQATKPAVARVSLRSDRRWKALGRIRLDARTNAIKIRLPRRLAANLPRTVVIKIDASSGSERSTDRIKAKSSKRLRR